MPADRSTENARLCGRFLFAAQKFFPDRFTKEKICCILFPYPNKKEKIMKKKRYALLAAIGIIVLALVLMLVNLNRTDSPVSNPFWWFYMVMTLGFGLLALTLGFVRSRTVYFFLAAALLDGFLIYLMIDVFSLVWYAVVIVGVMFLLIVGLLDLFLLGNRTEAIAQNEDPSYRTYAQKKAEEAAEREPDPEKEN